MRGGVGHWHHWCCPRVGRRVTRPGPEPVNTIKDRTVIDMLDEYFEGNQVMEGKRGFLFLYELPRGQVGPGQWGDGRGLLPTSSHLVHLSLRVGPTLRRVPPVLC